MFFNSRLLRLLFFKGMRSGTASLFCQAIYSLTYRVKRGKTLSFTVRQSNWRKLFMKIPFLFGAVLGFYPSALPAQVEEHPIDVELNACLEENPSTAGMVACFETAIAAWDKELNKRYKDLIARLPAESQDALRKAQRAWIAYRDSEFAAMDLIFGQMEGTMFIPMHMDRRCQFIRQRALELGDYTELLILSDGN